MFPCGVSNDCFCSLPAASNNLPFWNVKIKEQANFKPLPHGILKSAYGFEKSSLAWLITIQAISFSPNTGQTSLQKSVTTLALPPIDFCSKDSP